MATHLPDGFSRLSFWPRVREFAVPASMIRTATARRLAGDWAGACAAARVDVDLDLRSVRRAHGHGLMSRLRSDLRHLAPDLLRWHMPRIAPDGLLRPGLTVALARYTAEGRHGPRPVHLVARTPPAWADAGQRISLAVWDGAGSGLGPSPHPHPHPHPSPRFRLDLHRHLWDARRAAELRVRCGADLPPDEPVPEPGLPYPVPPGCRCAVHRWAAEAELLLRAEGTAGRRVAVRLGRGRRLVLELPGEPGDTAAPEISLGGGSSLPVLPDAATWVLPDLDLLRSGAIEAGRLHPLVAAALESGHVTAAPDRASVRTGDPHLVDCRGVPHRIGLVDGVLSALDHAPDEIRREELLAALTGTPLPCLRAIDEAHRRPDCLAGVRERLDHGDTAGALAVVEGLLGPQAVLRDGPLRDELEAAAERRISYGLFRAGLAGPGPGRVLPGPLRPSGRGTRRRHRARR
ncbi:hypothetical protein ABZT17_06885 [Streptomyces sp. NPDC005648]|uniref:hypothetical protein n=1 Tax=Streptomyces sp. NPDC005648 TaxID=3157044 RepID=UPI0033A8E41F